MPSSADHVWVRLGSLDLDDVPPDVVATAKLCVLDWLGCAIAGAGQPGPAIVRDEIAPSAERTGAAPSGVLGGGYAAPHLAALVNGTAGHALDFDDTNLRARLHVTGPVFPAALAVAEALDASGRDLLTAFVVGGEVVCACGVSMPEEHHARGWHSTSTFGVLGAAAAAARLLALDVTRFRHAFGLAASQSGGLQANFGTMTKAVHAGCAASGGTLAARLAARGLTAGEFAYEGAQGLVEATTGTRPAAGTGALRLDGWRLKPMSFKFHASCHGSHSAIESALQLRDRVDIAELTRVEVIVNPNILRACRVGIPDSGLAAKFSLPATVAMALHGVDTMSLQSFTDATVMQPALRATMDKVTVVPDADMPRTTTRVRVTTRHGSVEASYDYGTSSLPDDRVAALLRAKFEANVVPVVGAREAAELAGRIDSLDELASARELVRW